jgi:hypothetical protein
MRESGGQNSTEYEGDEARATVILRAFLGVDVIVKLDRRSQ